MVSSKWNNIRILQKRLSLQDKQICRPKSSNIEQFWTLSSNCNGIFWVQLNHPSVALRKRYPQKTSRCSTISNLFCYLHLGVIYSCLQKSWKSGLPPPAYPLSALPGSWTSPTCIRYPLRMIFRDFPRKH